MTQTHTCTVVVSADGTRCGKAAVYTFTSDAADGGVFGECAEHYAGEVGRRVGEYTVGDEVTVRRYGKDYVGTVIEVGTRGAVYARITYGNGVRRRVRVEG